MCSRPHACLLLAFALAGFTPRAWAAKGNGTSLESLYEGLCPAVVLVRVSSPVFGNGMGSGVIIHDDGYVVTAAHVVEAADIISVELLAGSQQQADIVTLSRTEDLALLKVPEVPKGTFIPTLADSDQLVVGQPIFCIGAPLGLKHTLTTGIVSAIRHDHGSELSLHPRHVIQTDAAINQGNSGGACFNELGEVVGIASFIASRTGGSNGLGFAVPSNVVRQRLFERPIPFIGVYLRAVPGPLAEILNWPGQKPLLVERVTPGSPAERGGLRGGFVDTDFGGVHILMGGDLIVKVGDYETHQAEEIHTFLQNLKAGQTIPYTIVRGGRTNTVEITLEEALHLPPLPKGGKPSVRTKGKRKR